MLNATLQPCVGMSQRHARWLEMTEAIFALESYEFLADTVTEARSVLQQLVVAIQQYLSDCRSSAQEIRLFQRMVFREFGFRICKDPPQRQFTLTNTLLNRSGSCLGLATLYVCVAEAVGVSMKPILFEGHIAVGHADTSPPRDMSTSCVS